MKTVILVSAALVASSAAMAQNALPSAPLNRFVPGTTQATLSVSAANATAPLPKSPNTGIPSVLVYNVGPNVAHFMLGDAQAVDDPTGEPPDVVLQPGCFVTEMVLPGMTILAAVSPAGPATLHLFGGTGSPGGGCVK